MRIRALGDGNGPIVDDTEGRSTGNDAKTPLRGRELAMFLHTNAGLKPGERRTSYGDRMAGNVDPAKLPKQPKPGALRGRALANYRMEHGRDPS